MKPHDGGDARSRLFADLMASEDGHFPPYRWQLRLLLRHLESGRLPSVVDIPTGLGKTSVMALWLMALAGGADVPRRLVYVVDRRAVVDQATRIAVRLRDNITPDFARKLGLGERALPISTLRGGFADNRDWLEDPSVPAIVVGTIDMVGSRLLFEGYGVSAGMRPYHAGFLAADTLVVLDEAHLCPPFEALLRHIVACRDTTFGPIDRRTDVAVPPRFQLMSLSATSRSAPSAFRLEQEDLDEPLVRQRLVASKRMGFTEIEDPKNLPGELARHAIALGYAARPARVVVYCNSRQVAVAVKALVDKEIKARAKSAGGASAGVAELLVGERRVHERSGLECWLEKNGFLGNTPRSRSPTQHQLNLSATQNEPTVAPGSVPAFLIATSAGEVGIDLDADYMVCDLVAYERMAQRLGRVNRRGGEQRLATVDVVVLRPRLKAQATKAQKQRHDQTVAEQTAWKAPLAGLPCGEDQRHDCSPEALRELRASHPTLVEGATTKPPLHPPLTRPCLEAWAMTSLKEHTGRPEVAPWLRGWEDEDEPNTDVVWRTFLPFRRTGTRVTVPKPLAESFFRVAPIHATERLEATRSHAWDWLMKRVQQVQKRKPDHELAVRDAEVVALVINRAGRLVASASLAELSALAKPKSALGKQEAREQTRQKDDWARHLAGATLVVTSRLGGLAGGMLDVKNEEEAPAADADEGWRNQREGSEDDSRPMIRFRVERVHADADGEGLAAPSLSDWVHVETFETDFKPDGEVANGLTVLKWPDDLNDDASRAFSSLPQLLRDHERQVASCVREMACRIGLSPAEVDALERAALMHDDGKASPRWQRAMNAPNDGCIYAKTTGGGNLRQLEGYRHEFGSLLKAERANLPKETRELILHLVAAHHGNARPIIAVDGCDEGPPSLLEAKAGEAALRYANLQRQYGIWGLAWREAILRAADQRASREWAGSSRTGPPGHG